MKAYVVYNQRIGESEHMVPFHIARNLYNALQVAVETEQLQGGEWETMAREALALADEEDND